MPDVITGLGNTLMDSMAEPCVMLDKKTVETPTGYKSVWVDGVTFYAVIRKDSTMEARIAEKQGVTELYTVAVSKGMPLDVHDVFRRKADGKTYRITSNIADSKTPDVSPLKMGSVTAERWDLPNA